MLHDLLLKKLLTQQIVVYLRWLNENDKTQSVENLSTCTTIDAQYGVEAKETIAIQRRNKYHIWYIFPTEDRQLVSQGHKKY